MVKTPLYEKFDKINVSEGTHMIPPYVRKVPTIEVPNAQRALVGEEVDLLRGLGCAVVGHSREPTTRDV